MNQFIKNYWTVLFPSLRVYQSFSFWLNLLEPTFHAIGGAWLAHLTENVSTELNYLIDSMPVMLALPGRAHAAQVARDLADVGYRQAKKTSFTVCVCMSASLVGARHSRTPNLAAERRRP